VQGDPGWVRGLAINQWSMQTFMVEDDWPDLGRVESDLEFADGALVGTVRNGTRQRLLDAVLVHNMDYVRLGDLAPGDEVEVRLAPAADELQFYGPPLSYRLFEEQLQYTGPTGPAREVQIKQQILDATLSSGKYSPLSSFRPTGMGDGAQGLALIAWLDRAPPDVRVARRQPAQQTTALFYLPLDYSLPESGPVSVPAGFVESRVLQMPSEGGLCGPEGVAAVYVGQGEAIFEFALGEVLSEVQIDQLTLVLRAEDAGWREAPELALYNWSAEAWTLLSEPEFGHNPIADPDKLISEDGLVRVRLAVDDRSRGSCYMVGMGFEGRRGP